MSGTTVLLIAIPVLVLLAAVLFVGAARRRDTGEAIGRLSRETRRRDRSSETVLEEKPQPVTGRAVERSVALERRQPSTEVVPAAAAPPVPWTPPEPEVIGVTRRKFLNRSIVNLMGFAITGFGLASIGFLWPPSSGGFGSKIRVGDLEDVKQRIREADGFLYVPEGRAWVTEYPGNALEKARSVYSPPELAGMEAGVIALYQKCVHLGCRVPACLTSQWFECPCHGSQYNQVGEKKGGPAPRGLDRFSMDVTGGVFTIDTGIIIQGPPIGTNTTGQEAEGPHCIGQAEEH
jgi:cytochrome b6-f complex iron-sulfur subunit